MSTSSSSGGPRAVRSVGADATVPSAAVTVPTWSQRDEPIAATLLTMNTYLFPKGLRHSRAYADKWTRARLMLEQMRRRRPEANGVGLTAGDAPSTKNGTLTQRRTGAISPATVAVGTSAPIAPVDSSPPAAAADATPQSILSADVVCCQEVLGSLWCRQWKKHFQALAAPTPSGDSAEYALVFSPPPRLCSGHFVDSGLMLASRFPILHSTFRPFRANPHVMQFVDKGFQHAVLDLSRRVDDPPTPHGNTTEGPRRVLHVINTHLHPYEASWSVEHGQQVRRQQVQEVRDYLLSTVDDSSIPLAARFCPATSALVMAGDLNTIQASVECHALRRILGCPNVAALPSEEPTMHNAHAFCNHSPEQTIQADYAIASKQIQIPHARIVKDAVHLSDHYPVLVEMRIH